MFTLITQLSCSETSIYMYYSLAYFQSLGVYPKDQYRNGAIAQNINTQKSIPHIDKAGQHKIHIIIYALEKRYCKTGLVCVIYNSNVLIQIQCVIKNLTTSL